MIAEDTGTRTKKMFVPTKSPLKQIRFKKFSKNILNKKTKFLRN